MVGRAATAENKHEEEGAREPRVSMVPAYPLFEVLQVSAKCQAHLDLPDMHLCK